MGNKIILLLSYLFILSGCNNHTEKINCETNGIPTGSITLKGFEKFKIDNIFFQNINDTTKYKFDITKIDSIGGDEIIINVNSDIYEGINNNDFKIIINDTINFLVTDINIKPIERFGNFGSVGYECVLIDYKVNDSIIKGNEIIIYNNFLKKRAKIHN